MGSVFEIAIVVMGIMINVGCATPLVEDINLAETQLDNVDYVCVINVNGAIFTTVGRLHKAPYGTTIQDAINDAVDPDKPYPLHGSPKPKNEARLLVEADVMKG